MKFQIISDLHLEFFESTGSKLDFIDSLKTDADYVLVAGDISAGASMLYDYNLLTETLNNVILVSGNHEYYHSNKKDVDKFLSDRYPNFLNNNYMDIGDVVIVGGTGWNSHFNEIGASRMNDFKLIEDLVTDKHISIEWARETYDYFDAMLYNLKDRKVICMTHNAPLHDCIPTKYFGSPLNPFFANNWSELFNYEPVLWVYGHFHESKDFMYGKTRVIENSFGYTGREENRNFNRNLIVDV